MKRRLLAALAVMAALALSVTGCGGGAQDSKDTVKVAYLKSTTGAGKVIDDFVTKVKVQFERDNPGKKVELTPVQASEAEYYTKAQLMMRSERTAADVVYEDTFQLNSDVDAGYLRPLEEYLADWPDWSQFSELAKGVVKGTDGKTYGVLEGTDTRGLWYRKDLLEKAGIALPWQPRNWEEVLSAARAVKEKVPGVTPINVYTGKPGGEWSSMQGLQMLLYGTGDTLYNQGQRKWVVGSKGFTDSLAFVQKVYADKLGPSLDQALSPTLPNTIVSDWFPNGTLAIDVNGSWLPQAWLSTGTKPWPEWEQRIGWAAMPTQHGQAPGRISMSGGWAWGLAAKGANPELGWKFITAMQSRQNAVDYTIARQQIAARQDVATDERYLRSTPSTPFFTELVKDSRFRPALPVYPKVSNQIAVAMEAVSTAKAGPDQAAKAYDTALKDLVKGETTTESK